MMITVTIRRGTGRNKDYKWQRLIENNMIKTSLDIRHNNIVAGDKE